MKSWIESANGGETHFPIQNLPCGVFSIDDEPCCGVAIGDMILNVTKLEEDGKLTLPEDMIFAMGAWNDFMAQGPKAWSDFRAQITALLQEGSEAEGWLGSYLVAMKDATLHLPFDVTSYTDFYAGRQHAQNMGAILRGSPDLPANWLHIPIGYNGRASTVVVSGTDIHRPMGQTKAPDADAPSWGPSKRLDIELEMGAVVGLPSEMGERVSVDRADEMIFGYVLLNDWSARDIQGWEYQPLGPFQGKAFATSISPWIVMKEALEAFRTSTPPREKPLLPYIQDTGPMLYDINLSVTMTPKGGQPTTICENNYSMMYYSAAQQLAHHSSSGCSMRTGDLLGSGTISGAKKTEFGSLMELSWAGREPITLDGGETRGFIEDGDTLSLHGYAQGEGYRIGFGECTGTILPAKP